MILYYNRSGGGPSSGAWGLRSVSGCLYYERRQDTKPSTGWEISHKHF